MGLEGLRELVLGTNLAVHGVTATVTRLPPDDTPIETSAIWVTEGLDQPVTEGVPFESALQRREPQRVLVLSLADVPTVPRGTLIVAPLVPGGADLMWRVDGSQLVDALQRRVFVMPVE